MMMMKYHYLSSSSGDCRFDEESVASLVVLHCPANTNSCGMFCPPVSLFSIQASLRILQVVVDVVVVVVVVVGGGGVFCCDVSCSDEDGPCCSYNTSNTSMYSKLPYSIPPLQR
jgi:hypothetical protein